MIHEIVVTAGGTAVFLLASLFLACTYIAYRTRNYTPTQWQQASKWEYYFSIAGNVAIAIVLIAAVLAIGREIGHFLF